MTIHIADILTSIEQDAPQSLAESWDNVGLLVGNRKQEVEKILVGLDPSTALLEEAISIQADTIITHHPLIFRPLSAIDTSSPTGKVIELAIKNDISIIACHTNLDNAIGGVSARLAEALGLQVENPLIALENHEGCGVGCIASFGEEMDTKSFFALILKNLKVDNINIAGPIPDTVRRVALCGGSGSGFASAAQKSGVDIYISAEIKHDIARWAEEKNFCIVDAGHYSTEQFSVGLLADKLKNYASEYDWSLNVVESCFEKSPFVSIGKNFVEL
ncbi:MAG: Nif3-like dinuclear metal center hexameric protein [Desulfotalea sp.]